MTVMDGWGGPSVRARTRLLRHTGLARRARNAPRPLDRQADGLDGSR